MLLCMPCRQQPVCVFASPELPVPTPASSGVPDPKIRIYDVGAKKAGVDFFPHCVHLVRCVPGNRGASLHSSHGTVGLGIRVG